MTETPLIVVPGIGSDGAFWLDQPKALVIQSASNTIESIAADTLAQCPDRFALAGHSMGGYIALEMVMLAPQRITGLALMSTSARADTDEQSARRMEMVDRAQINFDKVADFLCTAMLAPGTGPELRLRVSDMLRRTGSKTFIRQQLATMNRPEQISRLPVIKVPTVVITGSQDRIIPPERSLELSQGIEGSQFFCLEACGHFPTLEKPDETRSILEAWINSL